MNTSSTPASTYTPSPFAALKRSRPSMVYDDVQMGRLNNPAQVVHFGFETDAGKKTTTVHLLIHDPETIASIMELEKQLALSAGADNTVNSCIIRTVEDNEGVQYPVIRTKFTRKESGFSCEDPEESGACRSLADLEYGHLVLGVFRPADWRMESKVGITFYGNKIHCCGKTVTPIGKYESAEQQWL